MTDPAPDVAVSADDRPERCPYCERPFRTERQRALHVGERHAEACTDAERAAYEEAWSDEDHELFYYHLRVVATLAVLWAAIVLVYMVALGLR